MTNTQDIQIEDYNYPLPDDRIAKFPLGQRDKSKLLIYKHGAIEEKTFDSLPQQIPADSLIIFNNTKVIQARLHFNKSTGAKIEIFCLEPIAPNDYNLSFQSTKNCSWLCMVGNAKKWKDGDLCKTITVGSSEVNLKARKIEQAGNSQIIEFSWDNDNIIFADILDAIGELPIPPYLNRKTEESDKNTYQTVYSKIKGSVAAPTAGLHFTPEVFSALADKGVKCREVTLHVGAGTFQPVKSERIADHDMHTEFISVEKSLVQNLIDHKGPIIAVGTTSVRTLESLYYIGYTLLMNKDSEQDNLKVSQWQPYSNNEEKPSAKESLGALMAYLEKNNLEQLHSATQIMIAPGYKFNIVNAVVTNFHQPKSTLLLLISALIGEDWKRVYEYALHNDFRFLSYGDSSLLIP